MTMMSATYPVAGSLDRGPSTTATGSPPPWGVLATLVWFQVAAVASMVAGAASLLAFVLWSTLAHPDLALKVGSPAVVYFCYAVGTLAFGSVLTRATQLAGWSPRQYFALVAPRPRHILIGFGALIVYAIIVCLIVMLFPVLDPTEPVMKEYGQLKGNLAGLLVYVLVVAMVSPVVEEITFRGFMFRAFSASRLGLVGTFVFTSLIWASLHFQYNATGMTQVFGGGLLLCFIRWRSGSTVLTILLHITWNLAVVTALTMLA
jgi:membrane protease YdiL (CAAX protease family)